MRRTILIAALSSLAAGGCQSGSGDSDFENVRLAVLQRGGKDVRWNRNSTQDHEAAQAVTRLLADDLTLEESVQVALLNNRHLQAMYEDLGVAQADLVDAGLLKNPVFSAEIGFPESGGFEVEPIDPFGLGPAPAPVSDRVCHPIQFHQSGGGGFDGPSLDLSVAFDFLDILYIPLRKRIASEQLKSVEAAVTASVLELAGQVRAEFYTHQSLQHAVEMRQTALFARDAGSDFAERLHASGNLDDLRLAEERAAHQEARLELEEAHESVVQSRERLNRLMGLWGAQTQWKTLGRLPELTEPEPDYEQVEATTIENSFDLESLRRRMFAVAQRAGVSRIEGIIPSAEIGVSAVRADDPEPWVIGPTFSFPIPLFNWGQATRARALAELRRARSEYYATAVDLRSHARAARSRVLAARRKVEFLRDVVLPLRKQVVDETHKRYNAMFDSPFRLLEARHRQIESEGQYTHALLEYWLARTDLEQLLSGSSGRVGERHEQSHETMRLESRGSIGGHH